MMAKITLEAHEKVLTIGIILALILVDFLIFHDFLKASEHYTLTEYLTGIVSLFVFFLLGNFLIKKGRSETKDLT